MSLFLVVGCGQTRTYRVAVMNRTDEPVTVGFAKLGAPFELHVAAPEEVAMSAPAKAEDAWPSVVVDPGRTADTAVQAKFDRDGAMFLRVYQGRRNLTEVLSVSRSSPDRAEVPLAPGDKKLNRIVVSKRDGRIQAEVVERFPATAPTSP